MLALSSMPNGKPENKFQKLSFGSKNHDSHDVFHTNTSNHDDCQPKSEEILFSGNNLQVNRYYYTDSKGALCSWEGVEKLNDNSTNGPTDTTLCTIAVLKRQIRCDCLLLVRQYRAPHQRYTIEFPATVLNCRDTLNDQFIVERANREIKDETGYTSTLIKHVSPATAMDADITDGKVRLVSVIIDGDDPLQHASPANTFSFESGHGHIVQLLQLPLNGLLDRLTQLSDHDIIDSRVYAYAMGLQEGEKMAINQLRKEELNEM